MAEIDEINFTSGGKLGAAIGVIFGMALGFLGPNFAAWEMGKNAGEVIAWRKVPDGMRVCKSMLDAGPMNEIQEGYCAELLARALGKID